jgi:hypothetical protein
MIDLLVHVDHVRIPESIEGETKENVSKQREP